MPGQSSAVAGTGRLVPNAVLAAAARQNLILNYWSNGNSILRRVILCDDLIPVSNFKAHLGARIAEAGAWGCKPGLGGRIITILVKHGNGCPLEQGTRQPGVEGKNIVVAAGGESDRRGDILG
jgi:hypothetical protein